MKLRCFPMVSIVAVFSAVTSAFASFATAGESQRSIRFEVFENIPDKSTWEFEVSKASESFAQPWMAMESLPLRYNDRGVRADRTGPFLLRGDYALRLPKGEWRFVVRSHGAARLYVDGLQIAEVGFPRALSDGHEKVFHYQPFDLPGTRMARPGDRQSEGKFTGDDTVHQIRLEVIVGGEKRRPEVGELSVSMARPGELLHLVVADGEPFPLTDAGWQKWQAEWRPFIEKRNTERRHTAARIDAAFWERRHASAREFVASLPSLPVTKNAEAATAGNAVDRWIDARLAQAGVRAEPAVDDAGFLRRLSLDVRGVIPMADEVTAFLSDGSGDKRARLIDRFLEDPRWADPWVAYWQDVLAENPNLLNPTLNNTGPFRWWIYESFADNKAMDRFATELILMDGSRYFGGPAGFEMATENDVPMAAKAHIIGRAFLGMEMGCARCHDAPMHDFSQRDLFSLAAMLKRGPEKVPATSTIQRSKEEIARMAVEITLKPGESIAPEWTFTDRLPSELPANWLREEHDSREKLAALITSPHNLRFAKVIVNRLWERYLGRGLDEELDDWEDPAPSHPELLEYLARELMTHNYDLKHVARQILNSRCYQRRTAGSGHPPELFAEAQRRRMSAEQLLESLFRAADKPFAVESMNIDIESSRTYEQSLNLGPIERAWQFTSLSNDRDRASLQLPLAQQLATTLETFGWRGERQNPESLRPADPTALQPALLANGVAARRIAQLSEDSAFTQLAFHDQPLDQLIEQLFLRTLSRSPEQHERKAFRTLLSEGYIDRRTHPPAETPSAQEEKLGEVSWSSHLDPEASEIKLRLSQLAEQGDPPTEKLNADWRGRMEDAVWALINTPEFLFLP